MTMARTIQRIHSDECRVRREGLAGLSGAQVPASITESEHIIKAGVNYRFW